MSIKAWFIDKFVEGKLPDWMYRLIGKMAANKLGLKGNTMADITDAQTPWYRRKTSWVAILGAILSAVGPVSVALGHPVVIPTWIYQILGAMGLYTLRDAIETTK